MSLLAGGTTLLYLDTLQTQSAPCTHIATGERSEIESLVGFFVNILVLSTDLSGNPTFTELLRRVRTVALEAYLHQDIPFEKLVEQLRPDRGLGSVPLFQVLVVFQNTPQQEL